MGRLNSQIHEVMVTTLNERGLPHSAPMGITEVGNHFLIKPFKPSSTYNNLKRVGACAISYCDDVRVFAGALTGHREWPSLPCKHIQGEYLQAALAHSELEVIAVQDDDPRATFKAKVVYEENHGLFRGFNRAQSAVIEASIIVSRLNMLSEEKIRQEMRYLKIAIDKTAGERELEAWHWLNDKIKQAGIELTHE